MTAPYIRYVPEAGTRTLVVTVVQPVKEPDKEPYPGVIGGSWTWML